jgi:hypothetical protein
MLAFFRMSASCLYDLLGASTLSFSRRREKPGALQVVREYHQAWVVAGVGHHHELPSRYATVVGLEIEVPG